jgi:hypothetical protein
VKWEISKETKIENNNQLQKAKTFFEKPSIDNSYEKKGSISKSLVPKLESMILEDNKEEEEEDDD